MGKIRLHTIDKTLYMYGRSQMAKAIHENFCQVWDIPFHLSHLSDSEYRAWSEIIPIEDKKRLFNLSINPSFRQAIELWSNGLIDEPHLILGGQRIDCFSIALNTAFNSKDKHLKIAARLHGQSEIHCYVEGINRKWFAEQIKKEFWYNYDIIGDGVAFNSNRATWDEAITLIESDGSNPAVFSYSVCDFFPDSYKPDDIDQGDWENLSEGDKWTIAMPQLRQKPLLEMSPHNWDNYYFRSGWDAEKLNYLLNLDSTDNRFTLAKIFNEATTGTKEAWEVAKNAISA